MLDRLEAEGELDEALPCGMAAPSAREAANAANESREIEGVRIVLSSVDRH